LTVESAAKLAASSLDLSHDDRSCLVGRQDVIDRRGTEELRAQLGRERHFVGGTPAMAVM